MFIERYNKNLKVCIDLLDFYVKNNIENILQEDNLCIEKREILVKQKKF